MSSRLIASVVGSPSSWIREANTKTASAFSTGSRRTRPSASRDVSGVKHTASQSAASSKVPATTSRRSGVSHKSAQAAATTSSRYDRSPKNDTSDGRFRSTTTNPATAPTASPVPTRDNANRKGPQPWPSVSAIPGGLGGASTPQNKNAGPSSPSEDPP